MQGLRALYGHTGRAIEWRRLVDELIPVLTDPATGGPRPASKTNGPSSTEYQIRIAQDARDWATAQKLQNTVIAWRRQQAAAALTTPPRQLNDQQRNQIRNLAVALEELGQILREQGDPGCLQPYHEAMELFQRIGDRREEATVASNLGHAYKDIPALRDLDQAQHWYQRTGELVEEHDTLSRAKNIGQLGNIAFAAVRRRSRSRGAR